MLVKNISEHPLSIRLKTRTLALDPGAEQLVTPEEVRDATLRDHLQVRSIAVVRPATGEEDDTLARDLKGG